MGFFDIFRRPPPIRDAQALADFIDQRAAFVAQKFIYEYSRARAGHYSKVLFREPEFQAAAEQSRWRAFPLGLALVGELAEGVLRPAADGDRQDHVEAMRALVLSVFDRYPVPAALGATTWSELRAELDHRMQMVGLHAPKRAFDIPEQFAKDYFDTMPIHEKLRGADFPTLRNYLRVTMVNIHAELTNRLDAQAVTDDLRKAPATI
jgi:hypothetical protein